MEAIVAHRRGTKTEVEMSSVALACLYSDVVLVKLFGLPKDDDIYIPSTSNLNSCVRQPRRCSVPCAGQGAFPIGCKMPAHTGKARAL